VRTDTRRSFTVGLALIALQPGAPADAWRRAQSLYSGSITRIFPVERRQNKGVSRKCECGRWPLRVQEQGKAEAVEDRAFLGNPRVSEDPTMRSAQSRFASGLDVSMIH
jgi:hypothetical protein